MFLPTAFNPRQARKGPDRLISVALMAKRDDGDSELVKAAASLNAELQRFETTAVGLGKLPLNSQKNLERAAKLLTDVAEVDERMGRQVAVLVAAIAEARDRQAAQAEGVRHKAEEINTRAQTFRGLLEQFGALGTFAGTLNVQLHQISVAQAAGEAAPMTELFEQMGALAQRAEGLAALATKEDFGDIARQADGLRQQVLAARGKLRLLEKRN